MTRKPRSEYEDHTRKQRAARRQALLDAAARRMGLPSWSAVESAVRRAMEDAETDGEVNEKLVEVVGALFQKTPIGGTDEPPADVQKVYEDYPLRKAGRQAP